MFAPSAVVRTVSAQGSPLAGDLSSSMVAAAFNDAVLGYSLLCFLPVSGQGPLPPQICVQNP